LWVLRAVIGELQETDRTCEDSPAIVGVESCHRRTTGDRQDL